MKNWIALAFSAFLISCGGTPKTVEKSFVDENVDFARAQIGKEIEVIEASGKFMNPVTLKTDGSVYYCGPADWRSGFFPGSVWYLYELSGDTALLPLAQKYTWAIEEAKNLTWHHDIGFIINCSFGNGLRLTADPSYKDVMVQAAKSLSTRFREAPQVIQSWNVDRGWQSERGWECPVIIDNMMNLELLFWAARESGDSTFYKIAVTHADTTMKNHFRPDYSSFHVVDYDTLSGKVLGRQTHQGYADSSAWARGQAWGLYGYTVCYRETKDPKYLAQAENIAGLIFSNKNMPEDLIPYWDYDAPGIPDEPRDVSAATVAASALYELSTFSADSVKYRAWADRIIDTLSANYLVLPGTMHGFLLRSSTGHKPGGTEIDVPIVYADYYFLEALLRKQRLERGKPVNG